ncbi:hypothetical protein [Nannocystis pusilla]|uniref:hypothetical protein n=1 Tax=Nannocystis pusilla TaxID=889268 RepID=UPI003B791B26
MGLKETGKRMRSGFWSDEHFPIKDLIIADEPSDPFFHFTDERHGQLDAEWARSVAQKQVTPVVASQRLRGGKIVTLIVDGRCRKLARELHGCPTISVVIDNRLTDMEVASAILESFRRRPMLLADRVQQVCKVFRAALAQQGVEGRKPNEQLAAHLSPRSSARTRLPRT